MNFSFQMSKIKKCISRSKFYGKRAHDGSSSEWETSEDGFRADCSLVVPETSRSDIESPGKEDLFIHKALLSRKPNIL